MNMHHKEDGERELIMLMFRLDSTAQNLAMELPLRRKDENLLCAVERVLTICRAALVEWRYATRMAADPARMDDIKGMLLETMGLPEEIGRQMDDVSARFFAKGAHQFKRALKTLDKTFRVVSKDVDPDQQDCFARHRAAQSELKSWFERHDYWFRPPSSGSGSTH